MSTEATDTTRTSLIDETISTILTATPMKRTPKKDTNVSPPKRAKNTPEPEPKEENAETKDMDTEPQTEVGADDVEEETDDEESEDEEEEESNEPGEINIYTENEALIPTQAYEEAAGWDIYASAPFSLEPNEFKSIPTGIHVEIPKGYMGKIFDRSSMAKLRVLTSAGVIDSDFRGEVKVYLTNNSSVHYHHNNIEIPIAQMMLLEVPRFKFFRVKELADLTPSERGDKGFGSSNKTE